MLYNISKLQLFLKDFWSDPEDWNNVAQIYDLHQRNNFKSYSNKNKNRILSFKLYTFFTILLVILICFDQIQS